MSCNVSYLLGCLVRDSGSFMVINEHSSIEYICTHDKCYEGKARRLNNIKRENLT